MYRSWMFVPGNNKKFLNNSKKLNSDVLIFDLEDSVPSNEKYQARKNIKETITKLEGRKNFVRINSLTTSYFLDDLFSIMDSNLTGVLLPKSNNKEDIVTVSYILKNLEEKYKYKSGKLKIVPIIETAVGLHNAFEIVSASDRVELLIFGSEDFKLDMNITSFNSKNEEELLYAKSKLVAVSKAANKKQPIDSVFTLLEDLKGLQSEAEKSMNMGFQGKLIVHPSQQTVVNRVFKPDHRQIEEAKKIIESYNFKEGGVMEIDGKMVDFPIAEKARKTMQQIEE